MTSDASRQRRSVPWALGPIRLPRRWRDYTRGGRRSRRPTPALFQPPVVLGFHANTPPAGVSRFILGRKNELGRKPIGLARDYILNERYKMPELTAMRNIGKEMAKKLKAVEISTPQELKTLGSKEAFLD